MKYQRLTMQELVINPIQDGGGTTPSPTNFSPITSTNVEITHQNFLTFIFTTYAKLL